MISDEIMQMLIDWLVSIVNQLYRFLQSIFG